MTDNSMTQKHKTKITNRAPYDEHEYFNPSKIISDLGSSSGDKRKFVLGQIISNCAVSQETCILMVKEGILHQIIEILDNESSDLQTQILCSMTLDILSQQSKESKVNVDHYKIMMKLREMAKSENEIVSMAAKKQLFILMEKEIPDTEKKDLKEENNKLSEQLKNKEQEQKLNEERIRQKKGR
ncbi:MAG: hypothetical protein EZS28_011508 [Streblomastix strix]|uniref:Uncharacterized protein n=1 Tax=Streblomastix strix TaxID=222440 RepID=A0A5J4WDF8_9EUKA|nr:MAG: hypothetical protein EZS28_011508 [Streblomastix strix]